MTPRSWSTKYVLGLWLVAGLTQATGDAGFYLVSRKVWNQLAWLHLRVTQPVPDSLRRRASRYLRDSLGVTTERQGDTLLIRVPRPAERSLDGTIDSFRSSSRRLLPLLLGAFILLHAPLVIAILVSIVWLTDRARREGDYARNAPWQDLED